MCSAFRCWPGQTEQLSPVIRHSCRKSGCHQYPSPFEPHGVFNVVDRSTKITTIVITLGFNLQILPFHLRLRPDRNAHEREDVLRLL